MARCHDELLVDGEPNQRRADFGALRYRADSRLLVLIGTPENRAANRGISYFVWNGRRLARIRFRSEARRIDPMKLTVQPLTPPRWPHLEAIFTAKGCSIARQCWCMYYRRSGGRGKIPVGMTIAEFNKSQLRGVVVAGPPPGLIGYLNGQPVGWVSLGPREDYGRLAKSPVMKPVDDQPVWSIVCFVVPSEYRGQGVARALLDGAITYARERGAKLVEAYPVDLSVRGDAESVWFGTKTLYDAAGFEEVARRKPERPVVRMKTAS